MDLRKRGIYFSEFYELILEESIHELRKRIDDKKGYFHQRIYSDFKLLLVSQLQNICLRTLIVQLHEWKDRGLLEGDDVKEEYEFFCMEIVGNEEFLRKIFDEYPVLYNCVEEKVIQMVDYFTEVIEYFAKDREEIARNLCDGKKVYQITKIEGGIGDLHNHGKQVLTIELDNTETILFKPRSMENEQCYQILLKWLEQETNMKQYTYPFLSYSDHSWTSIVKYETCQSEEQLRNYYLRFGAQLFLAYFLETKDLHCENVISCGEYPVLIDLEALVSNQNDKKRERVNEEIYYQVIQSVLGTGLLPTYHWNQSGEGIDSSALSGAEGQLYPFKIPKILNPGTSEMCIGYEYPMSKRSENRATLRGIYIDASRYMKEIENGFEAAYRGVLDKKNEFQKVIGILTNTKSRILMADTQRYSMLLSTSYHPSLLSSREKRKEILNFTQNGRKEIERKIVESEVQSLWKGDIPYFYFELNRKGIFSNSEEIETKYFAQTAIEKLEARLEMLSEKDLKKQCEYIQVAMLLMPEQRKRLRNSVYVQQEEDGCKGNPTDREKAIQSLIERLMNSAAWNEERTEVNWPKVELSPVGKWTWRIKPLDMYLYGGVSGIFLLMCALKETTQRKETEEMFLVLRNMLFSYTEKGCTSLDNLHSRNTGAYDGESSIVYTYLSLYRMCGEIVFLEYAKKHAEIVAELLETDKKYDLLSGNAGAAKVFILLYEVTMEQKYIELAERAISVLELAAKKQEYGIGWCIMGDTVPMAGMAHGNSGILLPIVFLWKITGKKNYEELAEKILEYEDSLYDAELNNWKDMRGGRTENGEDTVAWCHGAAGILLSRVLCYKEVENPEWRKRLEKDIWKAYEKLKKYWKRDSWCLCHGTYGNLWILERAAEIMGEKLTISAQADIELLPQEMLNPGLFSGYGGILYYLLREKTDKISKILELYTV